MKYHLQRHEYTFFVRTKYITEGCGSKELRAILGLKMQMFLEIAENSPFWPVLGQN